MTVSLGDNLEVLLKLKNSKILFGINGKRIISPPQWDEPLGDVGSLGEGAKGIYVTQHQTSMLQQVLQGGISTLFLDEE